jgi:hypothetical protein
MARDLSAKENTITIKDGISGDNVQFRYRTPTASDIQGYSSATIKRKGNKVIFSPVQPKLDYGMQILTGVREGDFSFDGKALSSDPASPLFREDWKELLKLHAPDLLILLASLVFDGTRQAADFESEIEEATEDAVPFTKS